MSTSKKFLIKKLKLLGGEKWNERFKNSNICMKNATKILKNAHLKGIGILNHLPYGMVHTCPKLDEIGHHL